MCYDVMCYDNVMCYDVMCYVLYNVMYYMLCF